MLWQMLRIEHLKLYRRRALWIEVALVAGLIAVVFGIILIALQFEQVPAAERQMVADLLAWPNGVRISILLASHQMLGGLLMIVLVGMVVAQEYTWQTFTLAVRAGVPRSVVLISKFVTVLGPALLITATAMLAGAIMSGIVTLNAGGGLDIGGLPVGELLRDILRVAYALLPYIALTFLVAVWTRSLAASLGLVAGYLFLVEGIVPQLLIMFGGFAAQIGMHMPGQLASALINANGPFAVMEAGPSPQASPFPAAAPEVAVVGIALYTVIFLVLAVLRFRDQDLTA
ncbi:MAG: ABC transporter permease subunit [Chloroflexi bacterium]|nr:ABC transporter permease subunit [Chloroflexota bacterium]